MNRETVIVIDFGGQYNQLVPTTGFVFVHPLPSSASSIARRIYLSCCMNTFSFLQDKICNLCCFMTIEYTLREYSIAIKRSSEHDRSELLKTGF